MSASPERGSNFRASAAPRRTVAGHIHDLLQWLSYAGNALVSGTRSERFFNKTKQCRRIATRYDKLAANYLAFLKLAAIRI
jgi:hypothetical protein